MLKILFILLLIVSPGLISCGENKDLSEAPTITSKIIEEYKEYTIIQLANNVYKVNLNNKLTVGKYDEVISIAISNFSKSHEIISVSYGVRDGNSTKYSNTVLIVTREETK